MTWGHKNSSRDMRKELKEFTCRRNQLVDSCFCVLHSVGRGVNLGGTGDTSPRIWSVGKPMYNVPLLTFSLYFPLLRASAKDTLYSIYVIDKQLPLRSINHAL